MNFKFLLAFCLLPFGGIGQQIITFDDTNYLDLIMIDTISNPNNIWQIGRPQKLVFDSAHTKPNVIITDTVNTYPINDTSSFYLWHVEHKHFGWWPVLEFRYKIDADSQKDFGEISFSPDKGITWYNVLNDTIPITVAPSNKPFTGEKNKWVDCFIGFSTWDASFGYTDSILFKFTFYSDSISESMDGWMIDNIKMYDFITNVREHKRLPQINISPNPAQETIRIQFLDPNIRDSQELKIYSITGQLVLRQMIYPPESEINIETLESGVYMYAIGDQRGKMVVE